MRLLNLFTNYVVHYMFPPPPVIISCYKNCSVETAVLAFSSNVGCEASSHIRVFRGAACLLLLRCVFRPRVCAKQD
jgi:hypothetical protein